MKLRSYYNWSLSPEDPRQPVNVEMEVATRLLCKPEKVVRELVKREHLPTVAPRRKYQWYRFRLTVLLQCRQDDEWQRRAQEIQNSLWYRANAGKRRRAAMKKAQASQETINKE